MDKNENGYPNMGGNGGAVGGVTDGQDGCGCGCGNGGTVGSVTDVNGCGGRGDCLDMMKLAYVYAPDQKFRLLYSASDALKHGTLFEELYKPMEVYGCE